MTKVDRLASNLNLPRLWTEGLVGWVALPFSRSPTEPTRNTDWKSVYLSQRQSKWVGLMTELCMRVCLCPGDYLCVKHHNAAQVWIYTPAWSHALDKVMGHRSTWSGDTIFSCWVNLWMVICHHTFLLPHIIQHTVNGKLRSICTSV